MDVQHYWKINFVFSIVIILIFAYSAVFDPKKADHPIPSSSEIIGGYTTESTGLSRSFSSIIRFKFDEARNYNPHGLRVFLFFFMQLIFRIIALIFLFGRQNSPVHRLLLVCDANISLVLFVICFKPFWLELLQ